MGKSKGFVYRTSILISQFISATLLLGMLIGCSRSKMNDTNKYPESPKGFEKFDGSTTEGNWFTKDPATDSMEGVSSELAIEGFQLKNEREIVVAVIDSGVDINHEDLAGKIWTNPGESGLDQSGKERSNNGIDDDKNGYVDDIHGWNFIGGPDGKSVDFDTLELTRELVRLEKKEANGDPFSPEEKIYFEKIKTDYKSQLDAADKLIAELTPIETASNQSKAILKVKLNLEDLSQKSLESITSKEEDVLAARDQLISVIKQFRSVDRFYRILANTKNTPTYFLNKTFNSRLIVGDDPYDFTQTNYGNNDVRGLGADHGTHVAGIIAAVQKNGLGIDGIAVNVKIMSLRAVPNGDERDKDIALAVRYAAKNGAHIINMSFGKGYSPNKAQVDEAFLYAAEKGVLIMHAAGNNSQNIDHVPNFPNSKVLNHQNLSRPEVIPTWITVGASAMTKNLELVAAFSNYGKSNLDIFAPGHLLNSTVPDNKYAVFSGTSMAAPAASGTAALLMSNFPEMTALQAKAILLDQVRMYPGLKVRRPGGLKFDLLLSLDNLSQTGGVIDAYRSIQLARQLSGLAP